MLKFMYPNRAWLLLLILFFLFIFILFYRQRKKWIDKNFEKNNFKQISYDFSFKKVITKFSLFILAFIFIVIALMNPLEPKKTITTAKKEAADIFIILDISNSMLAEDIKPNRLEKSKQIIKTLLLKLGSDRVGIVLFAGDAFVYLPLTIDLSIANMMISEADPQLSRPQGTNINAALSTTFYAIERSKVKKPMVILFSDGENFEDDPNEILKRYSDSNIPVYVVALGAPEGAPIPIKQNGNIINYKRDSNNNIVTSTPNIMLLSSIASATGGKLIDYQNLNKAHEILFDEIKKFQTSKGVEAYIGQYQSVYLWFLIPAFLILLFDFLLSEHKDKWQYNFQKFIHKNLDA